MFHNLMQAGNFLAVCEEIIHAREVTVEQVKAEFKQGKLPSDDARTMIIRARNHFAAQAKNLLKRNQIPVN